MRLKTKLYADWYDKKWTTKKADADDNQGTLSFNHLSYYWTLRVSMLLACRLPDVAVTVKL